MTRTAPESTAPSQSFHTTSGGGHLTNDFSFNVHQAHKYGDSLGESGFEPETLQPRTLDLINKLLRLLKVHDESVSLNPTTLFQIIYITKQSDEELEDVLTYELCPFPLPLFDEAVMRKGTKSALYKAFKPCTRDFNAESGVYIIDGGYLLHRVIWKRETFSSVCDNYATYVRTKYKSTALVIFDGYPENETVGGTKCAERARRTQTQMSSEVMFNATMIRTVS
ncbi:hypothetical protein AVEN_182535-1 [Araneus ventricosus]|uniref:Uncharacterized protein n=1 Tax=Araneus ventricosus TaxID=182803 RepID=A0A4Y2BYT6_ARAVE|nr:hypothetical protein AVEN_182535-1 [Araneus ventricosus]